MLDERDSSIVTREQGQRPIRVAVLTPPFVSGCDGPEGAGMECGPLKREVSEFAMVKEGRGSDMERNRPQRHLL